MCLVWMILDKWPTVCLPVIGAFTVLLPFVLEIASICLQHEKFKIISQIHQEQRKKIEQYNKKHLQRK